MASTPRPHRYALPMATRSTDVSMLGDCPGRWVLTNFYEKEQAEASFFILGSQLHETIEVSIVMDLDLDQAIRHVTAGIERELERVEASGKRRIESSKRGFDSMVEDATRMMSNWFRFVHPDSDKRLEIYDEYSWPPRTERGFFTQPPDTDYPVWGSIDAVFTQADDGPPYAVVDWKSGTSRQRSSDQLHFYMYGLGVTVDSAWFHHLARVRKDAVIQMADPYPGDDVIRQRILDTEAIKHRILDGEVEFNPSFLCNWCTCQQFCPADGDPRNREANAVNLREMLKLARPLTDIEWTSMWK